MIAAAALELRVKLQTPAGRGGVRLSGAEARTLDDALALASELVIERQHLRLAVRREHEKVIRLEGLLASARKQLVVALERTSGARPVF